MNTDLTPTFPVAPAKAGAQPTSAWARHRSFQDASPVGPRPAPGRRIWYWGLVALLAALIALPAAAQDLLPPAPYAYKQLDDPAQEAKALALMETLRCLKCQSQSIADSDAPMAGDMRNQVRERIAKGEEPEAIRQWLIERYGDYVTYTPQVRPLTAPLFAAPLVFLAVAGLLLRRRFRKTKAVKP